jgi:DNA-binding beta-propeller fold protein YncE
MLAALGLLLVLVGALASVYLQQQSKNRVGVVEITKRVPQGQAITADEISEAMVAVDSTISYVTWAQAQAGALHGYTARADLVAGTLLVGQMLTTALPLAPGQEVVGIALKDGQYPAGIQVGDTVSAYYVSNKNNDQTGQQYLSDGFTTPPIVANVRVYDVEQASQSGDVDISLVLDQQYANDVTQAASGTNLVLAFDKHTQ